MAKKPRPAPDLFERLPAEKSAPLARPQSGKAQPGKGACIIGAGVGGLALAIRLQAGGMATTIVEQQKTVGGGALLFEQDGFSFDSGPAAINNASSFAQLWKLSGHDIYDDVEFMPLSPAFRITWSDGVSFDFTQDIARLKNEISRISTHETAAYQNLLSHMRRLKNEWREETGGGAPPKLPARLLGMVRAEERMSADALAAKYLAHPRLVESVTVAALINGVNPFSHCSGNAMAMGLALDDAACWVRGGSHRLTRAMARHFERLGGKIILGDAADEIVVVGTEAKELMLKSGKRLAFETIASNADPMHCYRRLLRGHLPAKKAVKALKRHSHSPGLFSVYFGLSGNWPGIPHQMALLAPNMADWAGKVFDHGVLPQANTIFLHHPSVTDPSIAPEGKSAFCAHMLTANMGALTIDWDSYAPILEQRILDEIGRRLIPDIHDRIITKFSVTPKDMTEGKGAYMGAAYGLSPSLSQSLSPPLSIRDRHFANLYHCGSSLFPGMGLEGVLKSSEIAAKLILEG